MAGTAYAGTDGRVTVNATTLNLDKWDVEVTAGDIKTTNFESNGYGERIGGVREAKVHASGFWDGSQNPASNPPDLRAGEIVSDVIFYVSRTANLFWNFPQVLVTSAKASDTVEGRVDFEFEGMSTAIYYYPNNIAG